MELGHSGVKVSVSSCVTGTYHQLMPQSFGPEQMCVTGPNQTKLESSKNISMRLSKILVYETAAG